MNNENFNAGVYSMKEIMAKQKQRKLQEDIGGLLMFLSLMLLCYLLCACSVKFEVGYHGETGRDDRTQTQASKK